MAAHTVSILSNSINYLHTPSNHHSNKRTTSVHHLNKFIASVTGVSSSIVTGVAPDHRVCSHHDIRRIVGGTFLQGREKFIPLKHELHRADHPPTLHALAAPTWTFSAQLATVVATMSRIATC